MMHFLSLTHLRTRLVLAFVGMVLLSMGLLAIVSGLQFRDFVFAQAQNSLTTETLTLSANLTETLEELSSVRQSATFQQDIDTLAEQLDASITILNPNGDFVIANTSANPDLTGQEIISAQNNLVGQDRRMHNNIEMIYVAAPVLYENSRIAIIQIGRDTSHEQAQIQQQWAWLMLTVVMVTLFALLLASWLAVTLTKPLSQLQLSVNKYASGDLSERFMQSAPYEIKILGDNFNTMAGELQSMIDEQRLFASNASHELRTPLASMKIRTELLLSDQLDSDIERKYLIEVDDEVTRLGGLIEDLFLLSRIDTDRLKVGREMIDIRRLVSAVLYAIQPRIDQKSLNFTLDIAESLPQIQANTNHIRTIVRNIVDNAIKYTPDSGAVTVTITHNEKDICIVVSDTGIGINEDDLARVTQRFYRADQAHSRTIPGHGLGMALVQSITTLYGGTLNIQSEGEGKGTHVRVELPV